MEKNMYFDYLTYDQLKMDIDSIEPMLAGYRNTEHSGYKKWRNQLELLKQERDRRFER